MLQGNVPRLGVPNVGLGMGGAEGMLQEMGLGTGVPKAKGMLKAQGCRRQSGLPNAQARMSQGIVPRHGGAEGELRHGGAEGELRHGGAKGGLRQRGAEGEARHEGAEGK